jgi:uncharacterized protein YdhG (YjbR/CyaY superfamily)
MAKTSYQSVDDYLAAQPNGARAILARVRATIRKAIPSAEETISYQIPTYKVEGVAAVYFAGWKEHFSVYPATATMIADLGEELASYKIAKGTVRFELSKPVPVRLIARIAQHRATEASARARGKREAPKRARGSKNAPAARGER